MKHPWCRTVFPIAAIFSFRMLGLFMLIPVFSVFASRLEKATPALVGIALGSYGLTQGILQMPFGILSDYLGRKFILTLGLLFFAAGSLLGAYSHSVYTLIAARTLQGAGAIGSVLIALIADLTLAEERTSAMAIIGATIGLSFALAMIVSPLMTSLFGLAGVFYLTAMLSLLGLLLIHVVVPTPVKEKFKPTLSYGLTFKEVFINRKMQYLNAGIFIQHFILTATFFVIPLLLKNIHPFYFYLSLMSFSFMVMIPFIFVAEKKGKTKKIFVSAIVFTLLAQAMLSFYNQSGLTLWALMLLYFIGFNILEAMLPSMVSKQAPACSKGTAMGIYSSSQFLGIFLGGLCAGMVYQFYGEIGVFVMNSLLSLVWLYISLLRN